MRQIFVVLPAFLSVLFLASCAKQEPAPQAADLPHATVVMRDGTRLNGTVAASSPSEITLNVDGGAPRTIAMKAVRRVDYGEAPASPPAPNAAPNAAKTEPMPEHENHHHAERAAIQTRT